MANLSDLTPREREILELIVAGRTNKSVAATLYISERTVEFHLDNIFTKLGVRTRLMAGIWAVQNGIREVNTVEIPR